MISRIKGILVEKDAARVEIMAGGVGYEIFIPVSTFYDLPETGQEATLFIKTVVREDAFELFGFLTALEKQTFLILNSVSKVGPRLALNILSGLSPAELIQAVRTKNVARLSGAPGVGPKTAERLVLELKDKIAKLAAPTVSESPEQPVPAEGDALSQDVLSALLNLGYSRSEAEKACAAALEEVGGDECDLAALLRLSLKRLRKA